MLAVGTMRMAWMNLLAELKRRNVVRAVAAYVAVAWLAIQVAETTFPAFGLTDRALRLLIIAFMIGFAPTIALAWVYELTFQGLKREVDVDHAGPLAARSNRLLDHVIVVLLALGITYFAVDKFFLGPAREQARLEQALEQARSEALAEQLVETSIAVLPFLNLSSDPEQAFFADGMAEELLNLLARIPELRVISRTSAFAFKGREVGIAEIAEKLKVTHVLEGSVRRSSNRLRITAQLIEARSDSHLWSEVYDRPLDGVFEVQDEIASRVVDALRLELFGETPRSQRVDPQSLVLFMQARQMLAERGDYEAIHDTLQRALAIDGNNADAWTGMSWLYFRCALQDSREASAFCRQYSIEEARRLMREARETALAIDPENAIAVAYGAYDKAFFENDWVGAASEFERAVRLDPAKADVMRGTLAFLRFIRRPEAAIRLGVYAVARDPLCSQCVYYLARAYAEAGRLDEAESMMRDFVATGRGGSHTLATILLLKGQPAAAMDVLSRAGFAADDPWFLQARAMALYSLGREEESTQVLEQLEASWGQERPELAAEARAWRGENERAYAWLDIASNRSRPRSGQPADTFGAVSVILQPLFDTPRGQALLRPFGLAADQLAQIRFEPSLPGE